MSAQRDKENLQTVFASSLFFFFCLFICLFVIDLPQELFQDLFLQTVVGSLTMLPCAALVFTWSRENLRIKREKASSPDFVWHIAVRL